MKFHDVCKRYPLRTFKFFCRQQSSELESLTSWIRNKVNLANDENLYDAEVVQDSNGTAEVDHNRQNLQGEK